MFDQTRKSIQRFFEISDMSANLYSEVTMMRCVRFILVLSGLVTAATGLPPDIISDWTYDSGFDDWPAACVTDGSGNLYITGTCNDFSNRNVRTMKYLWDGTIDFNVSYDGGEDDFVSDLAIDQYGDVYLAAETFQNGDYDACVIKYDYAGNEIWRLVADLGGIDKAEGIAVDADDFLHIVGEKSEFGDSDIFLMKATVYGDTAWTRTYDSGFDDWNARVALDAWGYGHIAANVSLDSTTAFRVIKYDWNGSVEWISQFNSQHSEISRDIAVDNQGDVFVTGFSDTDEGTDIRITKYSSFGTELWTRIFDGDIYDYALGIVIDGSGSAIITGSIGNKLSESLVILKYSPSGDLVWAYIDESQEDMEGFDLTVDVHGYLYVTAVENTEGLHDLRTQIYQQYFSISGRISDGQTLVDNVPVRLTGYYDLSDTTDADGTFEFMDLPCAHQYSICPDMAGAVFNPSEYEYWSLGWDQADQDFEMTLGGDFPGSDQSLDLIVENPVHLGSVIRYYLPSDTRMKLSVYDVTGREIRILGAGMKAAGMHSEFWPYSCSGAYLLRLDGNGTTRIRRVVSTKN